jgi:predicted AAA+ superfamily ATPase
MKLKDAASDLAYEALQQGRPGIYCLYGPPESGKTTLLREMVKARFVFDEGCFLRALFSQDVKVIAYDEGWCVHLRRLLRLYRDCRDDGRVMKPFVFTGGRRPFPKMLAAGDVLCIELEKGQ